MSISRSTQRHRVTNDCILISSKLCNAQSMSKSLKGRYIFDVFRAVLCNHSVWKFWKSRIMKTIIKVYLSVGPWYNTRLVIPVFREQCAIWRTLQSPVPHISRIQTCMQLRKFGLREHGSLKMLYAEKSGKEWVLRRNLQLSWCFYFLHSYMSSDEIIKSQIQNEWNVLPLFLSIRKLRGKYSSTSKRWKERNFFLNQRRHQFTD